MIRVNQENQREIKNQFSLKAVATLQENFCNEIHFKTRFSRDLLPINN